ncbi:hypothetical protein MKX03_015618 [Papaver bracteatum]|nr:hypothetical protein MKX03_015618 [Papaver bracteatum]
MHSKKRNRLLQSKLNNLIYIQYNRKLEMRCINNQNTFGRPNPSGQPIRLKGVDENDEWITPNNVELDEFANEDIDLTWVAVREAEGVDQIAVGPSARTRNRTAALLVEDATYVELEVLLVMLKRRQ